MNISYNWLKNYLDFDLSPEQVSKILTDTGLEVEGVEKVQAIKGGLEGVVIGEVLTKEKHPDADRLNVTTVNLGNGEPVQIVCGAPNVDVGQKVPVATVGATLYPSPDEEFKIKKSKIRGVESNGMICAEDELGLGKDHDGIMVLDPAAQPGTAAAQYFKLEDDYLIEIGLTPNRADAMGHIGVARDLKAYLNVHEDKKLEIKLPDTSYKKGNFKCLPIEVQNQEKCPRYAGMLIKNVTIKESPKWLKDKLGVIGLTPINNVVDITNFVLHETGNPLHAFDADVVGDKVVVRTATKGEKFTTLDEVDRTLDSEDLMIANASDSMCIGGVFGGLKSGVSEKTTSIFLEAAYFNPVSVRKTAKRHGLNTDASFRFERGVDPNNVLFALERAASLICELAGGECSEIEDIYPNKIENFTVDFSYNRCNMLIGKEIPKDTVNAILKNLDIEIIEENGDQAKLSVPPYRVDVQREADIVEEVLRIYGFNNVEIPSKMTSSLSFSEEIDEEKVVNTISDMLVSNGFLEIMNNSLTSSAYIEKSATEKLSGDQNVVMLNPLSQDLDVMRQSLIFNGLETIAYNQNRQNPDLKLFEFGKTYKKSEGKYFENKRLALFITGSMETESWNTSTEKVTFADIQGFLNLILDKLGINKNIQYNALSNDLKEDGLSIHIANKEIGNIGWINKKDLKNFSIKSKVYAIDLDWDVLLSLLKMNKVKFKELPKTQSVRRDFSLLLDEKVKFAEIREIAFKNEKRILRDVGLFDVYEGKNLDKGKKSYAVNFIFQDDEKTLQDKQVDKIMEAIRGDLESKLGAVLR
ncbi:MAG: phenylalanine--tRNA ligase subunit beta [Crocinitomicaceae bacterium]|nr:phenylalanine--tRNA ligase subunit beta [Crocinitomicaceae bacterium]